MTWYYFDANALANRYSPEKGTDLIGELFRQIPIAQMTCLTLSLLEIMSILVRKKNDGRLSKEQFDQAVINFQAEIIDSDSFVKSTITDNLILSAFGFVASTVSIPPMQSFCAPF